MNCLHDYKSIYQSSEAMVETCLKCHKRYVVKLAPNGKYNQVEYYNEHKRDFLQPFMKEFHQEYGNTSV